MSGVRAAMSSRGLRALQRAAAACAMALLVAMGLAACPSENQNPERLWLSLDGVETRVRLVVVEPEPF